MSDYPPTLGNYDELEKVQILDTPGTGGPFVRCGGTVPMEAFVRVDPIGYVKHFEGCPVHSPENCKIVGKVKYKGGKIGDIIEIDMQFNIRHSDCLCQLDDIKV